MFASNYEDILPLFLVTTANWNGVELGDEGLQ
jgi:hypothetical protein